MLPIDDYDYRNAKQELSLFNDRFADSLVFYRMPLLDEAKHGLTLRFIDRFDQETTPDILAFRDHIIISERLKKIVQAHDDFPHQFFAIELTDFHGERIENCYQYYWFHPHRFINIANEASPSMELFSGTTLPFVPHSGEEAFVRVLMADLEMLQAVESLSVFRCFSGGQVSVVRGSRAVVYFSEFVFDAIRAARLKGLDEYSKPFGTGEESLCALPIGSR